MWLDQLEREAVQTQGTEANLSQQYQVSACVCVYHRACALFEPGTDAPIINLISGTTLWESDGRRHISEVNLAYFTKPGDTIHIQQHVRDSHFFPLCNLEESDNLKKEYFV